MLEELQRDIAEIKTFLIGNDYNKKGLNQRIEELEKQQLSDKKLRWMAVGGMAVVSFLIKMLP